MPKIVSVTINCAESPNGSLREAIDQNHVAAHDPARPITIAHAAKRTESVCETALSEPNETNGNKNKLPSAAPIPCRLVQRKLSGAAFPRMMAAFANP